ncbi:PH domain-containing protein [Spiractinospora alimapuensis]|uniref:PH domain-containing protein n=1 Tax=Spiractinospora alimapuensis TaxID=2820884 RepID=UPI001F34D8AD|nr:PH domain-containing protein [Spiractinospora alimapuensis]QVQ52561.1 PH domain-containing protein [Spiractinospora alimapuensis]
MTPPRLRAPHHRVQRRAIAWWAARALTLVVLIATALGAAHLWWEPIRPWTTPLLSATLALGALYTAVMPLWRYSVHRWEATDNAVYHRSGWWVREWRAAPISRIQTVDTVRGPYAQLLGLATLAVTTASAHGAINIVGLDKRTAAEAAERLTEITQQTPGDQT